MIKEFLRPTGLKFFSFIGVFLLSGVAIQSDSLGGGKVGDLPLVHSLLFWEMPFTVSALGVLSGHLVLAYLMGCSFGFLIVDGKTTLNVKLVMAALGIVLPGILVFTLGWGYLSYLERSFLEFDTWHGECLQRADRAAEQCVDGCGLLEFDLCARTCRWRRDEAVEQCGDVCRRT